MSDTATKNVLTSQLLAEEPDMRDLVEEFVGGLSTRVTEFRDAFSRHDWEMLRTLAHRLKGAGGSYGYPDLSSLGATMEDQFKKQQADEFAEWVRQLDALAAAARAGLNQ